MARSFVLTDIVDPVKAPFSKRSLEHLNEAYNEMSKQLIESTFVESYTTNDVIILNGCFVIANIGGTSSVTAGQIYYNGKIYNVDANASISSPANTLVWSIATTYISGDPATFSDGNPYNFHKIEKFQLTNAVTGSGLADYNAATVKYKIRWIKASIGAWDMDTNSSVQINLSYKYSDFKNKVRNVVVNILDDTGVLQSPYSSTAIEAFYDDIVQIGGTDLGVRIARVTGGKFDNTSFNDGVMNRGHVFVQFGDI